MNIENKKSKNVVKAIEIFKGNQGIMRTSQALRAGIHPSILYLMRDKGILELISRGIFRLADFPPLGNPDLVIVAARIPQGIICLISALAFHDITTQIPHEVHVALKRGAEEPRLEYPPIRIYRFISRAYSEGIENHQMDGIGVRIYCMEKTLADCFKFRNKIGLDTAIEAVKLYRERKRVRVDDLMHYASICRVDKVMRPYLEAIV